MTATRLLRAEVRKLTTTRLPLWFLATTMLLALSVAAAVLLGAGTDDAAGMFGTLASQRSLLSFGTNAMMVAGMFGAIAVASEYAHGTVISRYLVTPDRHRALVAQRLALLLAGGVIGLVGGALAVAAGFVAFPLVGLERLVDASVAVRLTATATFAGAIGAVFGAGVGAVVRNTGGAVAAIVAFLLIGPPIVAQLSATAAPWVPAALVATLVGGVDEVSIATAVAALLLWGIVPAFVGSAAVIRRDVV